MGSVPTIRLSVIFFICAGNHLFYLLDGFVTFFRHSDPTKVQIGERNLADREVKLLKMSKGHTVLLNPPVTAASGDSSDSIDKMFDEENGANQEHSVGKDDDVLEEFGALDASELRDDHQSLPPPTGVKSLSALRGMVPEGSVIPSDATEPLVTASVTPMSDVGHVDYVFGLNLRTRPPYVRYVVSSDCSYYSGSYSETDSLVRYATDVSVVTVAVTSTVDANVDTGSKAKDAPKDFEHIGDYASAGAVDADTANISKLKNPSISSESFYASQSLDTEIIHPIILPPALFTQLCAMDFDQLYFEFNVGAARQVCLGSEVRMRAEHILERKSELEDRCAEQDTLLSEKDMEIAHLKSLLSLKEVEVAEAISIRNQLSVVKAANAAKGTELRDLKENNFSLEGEKNVCPRGLKPLKNNFSLEGEKNVLSERVEALESVAASKEVVNLTVDLSGFQLSRDELNSKKNSLEFSFEFFKEEVKKMLDEQVGVLSDPERRWILSRGLRLVLVKCLSSPEYLSAMCEAIGRAIDKGMQDGLAAGIEHVIVGRSITDVVAFNPSVESDYIVAINALQGVSFSLLVQLEANKDASMTDIMDLLRLEGPAAETSEASQLQPSLDQLMILIHRLEDQRDATARRLSLTDSILSLVEPLSARNLTSMTTSLSTTFVQTYLVHAALSTKVPPSPKRRGHM
nr:hypothetical protein [Tanacetum cinerariifolium]